MKLFDFKEYIVCASKYFTIEEMKIIYKYGIRHFGENKVNDLLEKKEKFKEQNIAWHMIGHLQTNKVKKIINQIDYLDSLDSIKTVKEIQKYRTSPLNCFIQVNLTEDDKKSGINQKDLSDFIQEVKKYDKIKIIGLMTIGENDNLDKTQMVFNQLFNLKNQYNLPYTSMGMSNDFHLALAYPNNYFRIGSLFKGVIHGLV